jgi:PilX N-terminal
MKPSLHFSRPNAQAGSAYVIALFVILLLSMLGLSLAFVTSTESQIGSNEELVEQTFFAADAGIGLAAAQILVTKEYIPVCGKPLRDSTVIMDSEPGTQTQLETTMLPTMLLLDAPCNLCEVGLDESKPRYKRAGILLGGQGRRGSIRTNRNDVPIAVAERRVTAILDVQPFEITQDAYLALERCDEKTNEATL